MIYTTVANLIRSRSDLVLTNLVKSWLIKQSIHLFFWSEQKDLTVKYAVPCPAEDAQQVKPKINSTPFCLFLSSFFLSASVSQTNMPFKSQSLPFQEEKRFEDFSLCKVPSLFVASLV